MENKRNGNQDKGQNTWTNWRGNSPAQSSKHVGECEELQEQSPKHSAECAKMQQKNSIYRKTSNISRT